MCSVHFFSEIQTSVNKSKSEWVHADNIPALTTPEKLLRLPLWKPADSLENLIRLVPVRSGDLSSASPLTSLCSWRDQPLLGTLVVLALQLPCERKGVEREGWEGREEEGMNQNTIKGTEWPLWELKACWLEAALGRLGRDGRRQAHTERERAGERSPFKPDPDIVPFQRPLIMPGLLVYTGLNKPA